MRAEASDKSELVTQLLFGETLTVLKKQSPWILIKCDADGYEGWIDEKQFHPITDTYHRELLAAPAPVALDIVQSAVSSKTHIPILAGSSLPAFDGMNFKIGKEKFVYNGQAIDGEHDRQIDKFLEKCSLKYLNAPYLWGGRSPFGIDCSGFVQVVFKMLGVQLPRDAYQQAEVGDRIEFVKMAKEGDLAYFENAEGKITHVGIVLSGDRIIHAHGKVRIDKLDPYGIYNNDQKKYTHKLRLVKRIL